MGLCGDLRETGCVEFPHILFTSNAGVDAIIIIMIIIITIIIIVMIMIIIIVIIK